MDSMYGWQIGIYDFTRKYYLLGRDTLINELEPPPSGTVLEIGCGTGRNLIQAAKKYPTARFYGLDVSQVMLDEARASILKSGLADRIHLALGDAGSLNTEALFGLKKVDRIFCSYTLSMIPQWTDVLAHALQSLEKNGVLSIVDFGAMNEMPKWIKFVLSTWLKTFSVFARPDLESVLKNLAEPSKFDVDFKSRFRGYAYYAKAKRH